MKTVHHVSEHVSTISPVYTLPPGEGVPRKSPLHPEGGEGQGEGGISYGSVATPDVRSYVPPAGTTESFTPVVPRIRAVAGVIFACLAS